MSGPKRIGSAWIKHALDIQQLFQLCIFTYPCAEYIHVFPARDINLQLFFSSDRRQ